MHIQQIKRFCAFLFVLIPGAAFPILSFGQSKKVQVIEIRNYLLKPGQRDHFIDSFETRLVRTLDSTGNYVLGQYRVKDEKDHFVWIRGFDDMPTRKEALDRFYTSEQWKKNANATGQYLVGYTNVHLLKPLDIAAPEKDSAIRFEAGWFGRPKGVTVIEFYIANEMVDQLVDFVSTTYDSVVRAAGVRDISYWVSEKSTNTYPNLPVFQDKNLLASISFFKDEAAYRAAMKKIEATLNEDQKFKRNRLVTTKNTWVLYPTKQSFKNKN